MGRQSERCSFSCSKLLAVCEISLIQVSATTFIDSLHTLPSIITHHFESNGLFWMPNWNFSGKQIKCMLLFSSNVVTYVHIHDNISIPITAFTILSFSLNVHRELLKSTCQSNRKLAFCPSGFLCHN